MDSSSIGSNDEAFEDTLCKPSLTGKKDEAKVATEKFLLDAISKADAHLGPSSLILKSSLDELFRDLSEVSGLCAWHSWKLARLLSLVEADACNLEMIQTLEEPLTNFFSGGFGDDFLVSVKDYTFYADIKLEECTEYGGVDSDLLRWAKGNARIYDDVRGRIPAMRSGEDSSTAVETLGAIETRLKEWKCCIRSMHTKKGKFQKIKRKIVPAFASARGPNNDSNQDKMLLGASPAEFERLIDSIRTHIEKVGDELVEFGNVTSGRHERALIILHDDIRLEVNSASTQEQTNGSGPVAMRLSDSTPYQRAQALELRVKDWAQHETEFCNFRNEIKRLLRKGLRP